MTGLDSENDTIMSLACFVTGPDLPLLDRKGFEVVIHHDKEATDRMAEWCTQHHGDSGLTKQVLESQMTAEDAAEGLLAYIKNSCQNLDKVYSPAIRSMRTSHS